MSAVATHRREFVDACLLGAPDGARQWIDDLEDVVDDVIRSDAERVDRDRAYPEKSLAALVHVGAAGVGAAEEAGGLGFGSGVAALALEVIARSCPSTAAVLSFHLQVVRRLEQFGGQAHADTLARLVAGEWIGASAWSELNAGADKRGTITRLEGTSGDWTLSGEKHFCTGLEGADVIHVIALAPSVDGQLVPSFVQVRTDDPCVSVPEIYELMGLRGSSTGTLRLESVRVDDADVIGGPGAGPRLVRANHQVFVNPGVLALGIARAVNDDITRAASGQLSRTRDISAQPHTRQLLADIELRVGTAYAFAASTMRMLHEGRSPSHGPNMAKVVASSAARDVAGIAVEMIGSRGFSSEWPFERHLRDAQATVLMGPSNELVKETVAGETIAGTGGRGR